MKDQLGSLGIMSLKILAPVFLALLGLLAAKLLNYITAKVKNEKLGGLLCRLEQAAMTAVTEVEQAIVSKLDPNVPLGENAKIAKDAALASLKTHMGPVDLNSLKTILGVDDAAIDLILSSHIESKVHFVGEAEDHKLIRAEYVDVLRPVEAVKPDVKPEGVTK